MKRLDPTKWRSRPLERWEFDGFHQLDSYANADEGTFLWYPRVDCGIKVFRYGESFAIVAWRGGTQRHKCWFKSFDEAALCGVLTIEEKRYYSHRWSMQSRRRAA